MRYFVTVGERTFEIELNGDIAAIDGESVDVTLTQVAGTAVRRLAINSQTHRLVADAGEGKGDWDLHLDGFRIAAEVVDERTRAIRAMTAKSGTVTGPRPVKAPMPGMIVRIDVQPGDKVRAGQGVVVIEAMKMENELKAEAAGTVSKIHAEPGTAVEKGTVLIEFTNDG
ncbi:MAG TPA: biotin/lipoyl-containing protein [Longimicrobiales bacterium]|nr:biotin/lipoyl-containing protein [Longimicrobiales bacterium]